jgi:hypothetical protein
LGIKRYTLGFAMRLPVPTQTDWGDYSADLDQKWAHDHFSGRTNDEMRPYFRGHPIEGASDLRFMPEIPFRYYMLGYRDYVRSGDLDVLDAPDAASCFLELVDQKLTERPHYIIPIMDELLPAIEYVAQNQAAFGADEQIYGNFIERFARIRALYEANT